MNDLIRPSLYQSYHQAVLIDDNSKGINVLGTLLALFVSLQIS